MDELAAGSGTAPSSSPPPPYRRKKWVIDPRLQYGIIAISGAFALFFLAAGVFFACGAALEGFRRVAFLAFVALSAVFGYVSLVLTNRIAGPLYNLKRGMRRARETGDLRPVRFRRHDLLQELGEEYNRMVTALNSREEKGGTDGFSLIELMIVVGLMSVVGLGTMQSIEYMARGQRDLQTSLAVRNVVDDIHALLRAPDACAANFLDRVVAPGMTPLDVADLRAADASLRYSPGAAYEGGTVSVVGFQLRNYSPIGALTGRVDLFVGLRKLKKTGTVERIERNVPIFVTWNNATDRKIVSCSSTGGSGGALAAAQEACEEMGGRYVDTPAKRCIFEQVIATNDATLSGSPARLHVHDAALGDLFAVHPDGRVAVGPPAVTPSPVPDARLTVSGRILFGSDSDVQTAGKALGYFGADADYNDLDIGSLNPNVKAVSLWNVGSGSLMDLAVNRALSSGICVGTKIECGNVLMDAWLPAASEKVKVFGDGAFTGTVYAGGSALTSDRRLKKNIRPLAGALARVLRLRGVRYEWKDGAAGGERGEQIGLIAQEAEAVWPEAVAVGADGFKAIRYASLVAALVESIKSVWDGIARAAERLARLESRVEALETEIGRLRADESRRAAVVSAE